MDAPAKKKVGRPPKVKVLTNAERQTRYRRSHPSDNELFRRANAAYIKILGFQKATDFRSLGEGLLKVLATGGKDSPCIEDYLYLLCFRAQVIKKPLVSKRQQESAPMTNHDIQARYRQKIKKEIEMRNALINLHVELHPGPISLSMFAGMIAAGKSAADREIRKCLLVLCRQYHLM